MKWISVLLCAFLLIFAKQALCQGCSVSAVPVRFGEYNSLDHTPVDAIGSIAINCSPGITFTVKLGPGDNAKAEFNPRRMRSSTGGQMLNYNLYRDAVRAVIWGDGTNNTFIQSGVGTGRNQTFKIYGRLPGGQNVKEGIYIDSIAVTVEW